MGEFVHAGFSWGFQAGFFVSPPFIDGHKGTSADHSKKAARKRL